MTKAASHPPLLERAALRLGCALAILACLCASLSLASQALAPAAAENEYSIGDEQQKYSIAIASAQTNVVTTRLRISGSPVPFGALAILRFQADASGSARFPLAWESPKGRPLDSAVAMNSFGDRLSFDKDGMAISGLAPGKHYRLGVSLWMFSATQGSSQRSIHKALAPAGLEDCYGSCMLAIGDAADDEHGAPSAGSSGPSARALLPHIPPDIPLLLALAGLSIALARRRIGQAEGPLRSAAAAAGISRFLPLNAGGASVG